MGIGLGGIGLLHWILLGASLIGVCLSLWIVIPAPIFALLPLSIGTPEVSPWLAVGNGTVLVLALWLRRPGWVTQGAIAVSTLSLLLSLLPLSQFPAANHQIATEMRTVLGPDYATAIPAAVQQRPRPFVWRDAFQGIPIQPVRIERGIQFAQPEGIPLTLNVYRPPVDFPKQGSAGRATIVMFYGGAWRTGTPENNETFSRYMASQGYVVVAPDYRHAPQHRFPKQLEDVQAALAYLKTHAEDLEIDLNRLALMGRSAGSQLAMLAAGAAEPLPVQAVVNYYGPVNLTAGYQNPPVPDPIGSRDVLQDFLGGTPAELPDLYRQASPINAVRPDFPPTLLVYAGRDHIVQSKFGKNLYRALRQQGNQTVVFLEIPWADHVFDSVFNGVSNQLALYYTERFLAWALQPGQSK